MTSAESVEKAVQQTIEGYSKALIILTAALTSLANTAASSAEIIVKETAKFQKELEQAHKDKVLMETFGTTNVLEATRIAGAMLSTKEESDVS